MRFAILFGLILPLSPHPAFAQTTEMLLQAAIVREGRACSQVVTAKAIGKMSGGSALVAVACSDGRHHVVEIRQDLSLNYLFSCLTYEATTNRKCF